MVVLFFVGVVEMLIVTFWTKAVTETRVLASGLITMVNIMIWYYVLQQIMENVNNWQIAIVYALGCSLGTVVSTYYFKIKEKKAAAILTSI